MKEVARFEHGNLLPIARAEEVRSGKAYIRTSISGESRDYEIAIEKISLHNKDAQKSLKIRVVDEKLLALTGGIVQGLSGSPIIQDDMLVGAVTHVLVADSSVGFGILAEKIGEQK